MLGSPSSNTLCSCTYTRPNRTHYASSFVSRVHWNEMSLFFAAACPGPVHENLRLRADCVPYAERTVDNCRECTEYLGKGFARHRVLVGGPNPSSLRAGQVWIPFSVPTDPSKHVVGGPEPMHSKGSRLWMGPSDHNPCHTCPTLHPLLVACLALARTYRSHLHQAGRVLPCCGPDFSFECQCSGLDVGDGPYSAARLGVPI